MSRPIGTGRRIVARYVSHLEALGQQIAETFQHFHGGEFIPFIT
jgi:hypothetical protein